MRAKAEAGGSPGRGAAFLVNTYSQVHQMSVCPCVHSPSAHEPNNRFCLSGWQSGLATAQTNRRQVWHARNIVGWGAPCAVQVGSRYGARDLMLSPHLTLLSDGTGATPGPNGDEATNPPSHQGLHRPSSCGAHTLVSTLSEKVTH